MTWRAGQASVAVVPGMSHDEIVKVLPAQLRAVHQEIENQEHGKELQWAVRRDRCFLVFDIVSSAESRHRIPFVSYGVSPSVAFVNHIKRIIHLPGLRGNPRRTYPKTAGGPEFQGTLEPYIASVIAQWQGNNNQKHLDDLAQCLEHLGLTWKVKAEPVDDTQVELKVGRLPHSRRGAAHDLVSIADVGFGVSQSLPVVVALLAAQAGQLVYLEQPEIHLHPLAQRRLASVLKGAVERGVIAVVETHSALLLREVQTLIDTGHFRKEDVVLHWLERDQEGATTVRTARPDDNGAYGEWPEDFDKTELEAEKAYLDAVEGKEAGK
ncbi:MAG: AAA family ATPase [Planctomycetota bacterium]